MGTDSPMVFVVDDDVSVCRGLGRLLRSCNYRVETFDSAETFLQSIQRGDEPGCLVLDVKMPGLDGLALHQHLTEQARALPVVFLTGHGDIPMSVRAIKAGAQDFLTKPVDEDLLLAAVSAALERHRTLLSKREALGQRQRRIDALTPRELEVVRCVLSGVRNKQIGAYLGIAEKTVKVHRGRAMDKLGAASVADLVMLCAELGIKPQAGL